MLLEPTGQKVEVTDASSIATGPEGLLTVYRHVNPTSVIVDLLKLDPRVELFRYFKDFMGAPHVFDTCVHSI